MTTIPFKNYTRYNTDDLAAILNHVETYVRNCAGTVRFRSNDMTQIEFAPYTQGVPRSGGGRRRYNRTPAERSYVGRGAWRNYGRLPLVEPQHAFESEIEWLTIAASDQPCVPYAMVTNIMKELVHRFAMPWNRNAPEIDNSIGLRLRIEGKVAQKKSKQERELARLVKGGSRVQDAKYVVRKINAEGRRLESYLSTAKKHFGADQELGRLIENLIATSRQFRREVEDGCEAVESSVNRSMEQHRA